jgi:hypothetical protein
MAKALEKIRQTNAWTDRAGVINFIRPTSPMNAKSTAKTVLLAVAGQALVSCAAVKETTANAAAKVSSYAKLPDLVDTPIARLMPAGGLKVVEVREKELKDLPSGHDRALAYRNDRKRGFWIFGGPVDFQEPVLPEPGSEMDGSLLPPRMP